MPVPGAGLNLTQLSHFLEVAGDQNMTSAAGRLHMTQQAVSSSVRHLERELGVPLFHRHGRRLELTSAGHVLREGARALVPAARSLAAATRAAGRPEPRPWIVGHTPAFTSDEVYLLLDDVRTALPDVPVHVRQMFPDDLTRHILDSTVDLGLRRGVVPPSPLAGTVIAYHRLSVAVRAGHPLTERETLTMSDLSLHTLMVWAPPGASFYTDYLLSVCRRAGFEPALAVDQTQGTAPATAVDGTDCYAFVTQSAGSALGGRVHVIPLDDPPRAPTQALWLPHTRSAPRDALLASRSPAADVLGG